MGRGIKGNVKKNSTSLLSSKPTEMSAIDRMRAQMQACVAAKAAAAATASSAATTTPTGSSIGLQSPGARVDTSRDGQLLSSPTSLDQGATHSQLHSTPLVQSPHQAEGTTSKDLLPGGFPHHGNSLSPSRRHGESPSGQSPLTPP